MAKQRVWDYERNNWMYVEVKPEVKTHVVKDESLDVSVDPSEPSPEVIDLLANLTRRVSALERDKSRLEAQLSRARDAIETFAQQTESNRMAIEKLTDDVVYLDAQVKLENVTDRVAQEIVESIRKEMKRRAVR